MSAPEADVRLVDLHACFEGVVPAVIATAGADGVPNVTYLSKVRRVDDERVALSNQFFSKTAANLAENPRAELLLVDPGTYDEYRLTLVWERTERRGPVFEQLRSDVDTVAHLSGMQDVFRLRAADIYRVEQVDPLDHGHGPPAPTVAAAPAPHPRAELRAVAELAARLSRSGDPDTALSVALRGLQELLGHRHSMVLVRGAAGDRLSLVAAHGYDTEAVGAELKLGEGEAGLAALRGVPVRIGNLRQARKYSATLSREYGHDGVGPGWELPLPRVAGVASRLAVPVVGAGEVVGVLVVESDRPAAYDAHDEAALGVVAAMLAGALADVETSDAPPDAAVPEDTASEDATTRPGPARDEGPSADSVAARVRFFAADGSVFLDGDYLIKGVAGRILWSLLCQHRDEGRTEFTNREVRLDRSLGLPEFRDNLDTRLLLLRRRLEERGGPVRIERTGRGRFRLVVTASLRLEPGDHTTER